MNINASEITVLACLIVEKALGECSIGLLEAEFVSEFGRWHLKIYIYNPENTEKQITHDDCEAATAKISEYSEVLDNIIPVPYYLEISSPGTERKLKSSKEYTIFRGKRVKVKLKKPINTEKTFFAAIEGFKSEKGLELKLEKTQEIITVEESNISSVKLEPKYNF